MTDAELQEILKTLAASVQGLIVTVDKLLTTTKRLTSTVSQHDKRLGEVVGVVNSHTEQLNILVQLIPSHDERLTRIEAAVERFISARNTNGGGT
ncbi:MAG: hypothetical protein M3R15_32315 [Acidobacteriota bacterium]|nr:hypothetical protein [Acidobacteriota bacterium]